MIEYRIIKPFKGSPDGARTFDYETGDIVPNQNKPWSDDLARVALRNKWARKATPARTKATNSADSPDEKTG